MMSEYAELILVMSLFAIFLTAQIHSLETKMTRRLRDMEDDLCRIEAKVDGTERHREAR
jgi:hypothetical protein